MPCVRPPAVAGLFYPARAAALRREVEDLLSHAAGPPAEDGFAKALIAPHAGYVYSGPVAASAFAAWRGEAAGIRRIVLLGPAHRVPVRGLALPGCDALATPLGEVPVDGELAAAAAALPAVEISAAAHAPEHSLEVELPFLQVLGGAFRLLPLLVGDAAPEEVAAVLERVWGGPETRILVSSDLSHYLPYEPARRVDRETAAAIENLAAPLASWRACGAYPINGLLAIAARRGLRCRTLDLRNSGDTAGDRARVVGYGAFLFREPA